MRNLLGAFLFSGDDVFKKVSMLSGGEKVRLALCKIFKRQPNVLILDEPTNHMDIVGKETLEAMLKEFPGTLIFVSHDRYFVKQVSNKLLVFENGTTKEYRFGYDDYMEQVAKQREANGDMVKFSGKGTSDVKPVKEKDAEEVMTAAKSSYNFGKEKSKLERRLKKVEDALHDKETKTDELKDMLADPAIQSDYIKLGEIQAQIDELEMEILEDMEEWENISTELEQYQ